MSELAFDYCVLCTGTWFEFPINSDTYNLEDRAKIFWDFGDRIEESKSVLVVGSGATGLEIAGNLNEEYKTQK